MPVMRDTSPAVNTSSIAIVMVEALLVRLPKSVGGLMVR